MIRIAAIVLLAPCLLGGCSSTAPPAAEMELAYPVRADWLVMDAPKVTATKWYDPGLPPLLALDLPETALDADQKVFRAEVKSKNLVDTRDPGKFSAEERKKLAEVLTQFFGTPAQPKIAAGSDVRNDALQLLQLQPEVLARGSRLYLNFCANCHGLSGDGNGPAGRFLLPMPRDYRRGEFKFVTAYIPSAEEQKAAGVPQEKQLTPFPARPLRDDIYRTITHGLPGSPMPAFDLPEADLQALVSHVIFLAIRGETEYQVMKSSIRAEEFPDPLDKDVQEKMDKVIVRWAESARRPMPIDADPYADADRNDAVEKKLLAAARGYELFNDAILGGCTKCHTGYGKAAPYQYDAWGTIVRPRNLTVGIFRGGRSDRDLYARIYGGIAGVGMPSHPHLLPKPNDPTNPTGTHRLWNVVHFIRVLVDPRLLKQLKDPARMKAIFDKYGAKEIPVIID